MIAYKFNLKKSFRWYFQKHTNNLSGLSFKIIFFLIIANKAEKAGNAPKATPPNKLKTTHSIFRYVIFRKLVTKELNLSQPFTKPPPIETYILNEAGYLTNLKHIFLISYVSLR